MASTSHVDPENQTGWLGSSGKDASRPKVT